MSAAKKSYFDLAKEAIGALKDRTGSSSQAIKAYITTTHPSVKFQQVCDYFCIILNHIIDFFSF